MRIGCSLIVLIACGGATSRAPQATPQPRCAKELLDRLAATEIKFFEVMDLERKYLAHARSRANEVRIRPFLDLVFGTNAGGPAAYTVECHANACKISINKQVAPGNWMRELQTHPAKVGLASAFSFGSSTHVGLFPTAEDLAAARTSVANVPCVMLEARLAGTAARVEEHLPITEQFTRAARSGHHENELRPRLDAFFGARGIGAYKLECHNNICRIDADVSKGWVNAFQVELDDLFEGVTVGGSGPTLMVIAKRKDPAEQDGKDFIDAVMTAIDRRAAQTADCKRRHAARVGEMSFDLRVDNARSLLVAGTGSLAGTPVAACFREIVDAAIADAPFPVADPIYLPERSIRFWVHPRP